jgi:hypothetical protein
MSSTSHISALLSHMSSTSHISAPISHMSLTSRPTWSSYHLAALIYEMLLMFSTPRGWTPGGRAGGRAGPRRSGRGARGAGAPAHRSTPLRRRRPCGAAPRRPQRALRAPPPPTPKRARQPRARTRCAPAPPRLRSHGPASGLKRGRGAAGLGGFNGAGRGTCPVRAGRTTLAASAAET